MTAQAQTDATTAPEAETETVTPERTPDAATTPVDPAITASIPPGQKSPALFGGKIPNGWSGSRSVVVSDDGKTFAFIGNNGQPYQGFIASISPRALAFGYAFGAKQKADSDGATDKDKTAATAQAISGESVQLLDWCAPRVSGPREETATPLDLQIKTTLVSKLKPTKDPTGKLVYDSLSAAVRDKKIRLTGFSGSAKRIFARYAEVVKAALDLEPTDDQWATFVAKTTREAQIAIDAAKTEAPFG